MKKGFATVQEVSELFDLSTTTVYRLIKAGKLPVINLGRKKLIPKKYLETLMNERHDLKETKEMFQDMSNNTTGERS